jgi:hypothetical protein
MIAKKKDLGLSTASQHFTSGQTILRVIYRKRFIFRKFLFLEKNFFKPKFLFLESFQDISRQSVN